MLISFQDRKLSLSKNLSPSSRLYVFIKENWGMNKEMEKCFDKIKYESVCFFVSCSNKKFNPKSLRCGETSLKLCSNHKVEYDGR